MSTFDGKLEEIPGISIDEFVDKSAKCYFLSHCHSDHTRGLSQLKTDAVIYTSSISALFLREKCPQISKNIRILELGIPNSVEISQDDETPVNFVVTAISAGHCAGSFMLLFQIEGCDILYTGDFRISLKNAQNIKLLKEIQNNSKTVVYLDSTFLKKTFQSFPSQTESVTKVLEIVDNFLKKSTEHKVNLITSARYGYEYLLMELSSKLNEKIFIHENDVFDQYSTISLLNTCVTKNDRRARIFLKPTFVTSNLELGEKDQILNLHLSAMFWTNWKRGAPFVLETKKNSCRVCYATHNSLEEIRDFLTFLKPRKVNLNVLPESFEEKQKMIKELEVIEKFYHKNKFEATEKIEAKKKFSFKRLRELNDTENCNARKKNNQF